MHEQDKQQFAEIVKATFDNYTREQPMNATLRMWWELLAPFDIADVRKAMLRYVVENPKYAPTVGAILEILNAGKSNRLGSEEAWAIAVKACDETETVLLTDEISQAWGVCKPIMDLGDEVGARMAFKEAYARISAKSSGPAKWWPSIGSDPHKRDAALSEAKRQGLLPAPQVKDLLPPPMPTKEAGSPEGLKRLKEEMAKLNLANRAKEIAKEEASKAERDAVLAAKKAIADKIENYRKGAQ